MPAIRTARRKEQSRSAAKSRRLTETEVYVELAKVLPGVGQQTVYQSDRIGLLRLASMMFRTQRLMTKLFPSATEAQKRGAQVEQGLYFDETTIGQCLDGFVMVVNKGGQMLYVSPGASSSIGFTQADIVGKYIRDYVHTNDWQSLCQHLRVPGTDEFSSANETANESNNDASNFNVFFRMKTAMTPRGGRARKLTMAVYQPIQAHIIDPGQKLNGPSFDSNSSTSADEDVRLVFCTPYLLSPLQKTHSSTSSNVTSTRHEIDMRFRFCSDKLATALQYGSGKQLINQPFYHLVYPQDVRRLAQEFRQMYKNGHVITSYYRLSTKSGGYIWAMTEAALLVQNIRGVTQKSVVCNHYIISTHQSFPASNDCVENVRSNIVSGESRPKNEVATTSHARTTVIVPTAITQGSGLDKSDRLQADQLSNTMPTNFTDPNNQRSPPRLITDKPELFSAAPPNVMEKLGLLTIGGAAAATQLELNSIIMAAMNPSFPFANSMAHSPKPYPFAPLPVFSLDRSNLGTSLMNGAPNFRHIFSNPNNITIPGGWPSPFTDRFSAYQPPVALVATTEQNAEIGLKMDETDRRHRLDAKTIETFEIAMIKSELTVGNE